MKGDPETLGKRTRGRPTQYNAAYCNQVLELGNQGCCKAEIAGNLGVPVSALDSWAASHSEFRDAIRRARALEYAWWLEAGRKGINDKSWNLAGWELQMQNRFGKRFTARAASKQAKTEPKEPLDAGRIREDMERKLSRIADAGRAEGVPQESDLPRGW
jgi:hypothetical protein